MTNSASTAENDAVVELWPNPAASIFELFICYGGDPRSVSNECAAMLTIAEILNQFSNPKFMTWWLRELQQEFERIERAAKNT